MKYDYKNIIYRWYLSYNELTALLKHINYKCDKSEAKAIAGDFNNRLNTIDGLPITAAHFQKAYKYLVNSHFLETGEVRTDSPFTNPGLIDALNTLESIEIIKVYAAGTIFKHFYTYQFRANGSNGQRFNYFVFNNKIQISNQHISHE